MKGLRRLLSCNTGLTFILFVLFVFILAHCHYDANPPSDEELAQYRPFLVIKASGLDSTKQILFQFSEDGGTTWQAFTSPLYVTPGGDFLFSYLFNTNVSAIQIKLIIDGNNNDKGDSGEAVYTSAILNSSQQKDRLSLELNISDFSGSLPWKNYF